jgi:L-lactate dehydrogenase (cytochrome)
MGPVATEAEEMDSQEVLRQVAVERKPILEQCYNLMDFEAVARRVMKRTAWAYYSSGADDEIVSLILQYHSIISKCPGASICIWKCWLFQAMRENHTAYQKVWFRPRVLIDVEKVDFSTTMLGTPVRIPYYVTATALGKLGNPEGEVVLTRAAAMHNVIQMIPTLASCSFDEIVDAATETQVQWLQLYVNKDRDITKRIVQNAERRGCRGLFITVDAPQLGRREKDMRSKFVDASSDVQSASGQKTDNSQGAARAISSFIDPSLKWSDIPWFFSITRMPIVLKGIQRIEDVIRAIDLGVAGVVLSNHGGRQLDFARSGIEILAEVMPALRQRGLENKIEIYVDGGVRRATDILKALCLGAKGVGIGRPFLFAMSAYGLPGVDRAMTLLEDEMTMSMRLIGAATIADLAPDMVDASGVANHSTLVPVDTVRCYILWVSRWLKQLNQSIYDPLTQPKEKAKL